MASDVPTDKIAGLTYCHPIDKALIEIDVLQGQRAPITGIEGFLAVGGGRMPLLEEILDLSDLCLTDPERTWAAARNYLRAAAVRREHQPNFIVEIFYRRPDDLSGQ